MFRDQTEKTLFRAGTVPETVPVRSLISSVSTVKYGIAVCQRLLYCLQSSGKPCKNTKWSTVSGWSCDRRSSRVCPAVKKTFKRSACRWCWLDPSSTRAQLKPYVLLSMPTAEHIRSTVSRAVVAVEFSAQCSDAAAPRTQLCWWIHWMRRWTKH